VNLGKQIGTVQAPRLTNRPAPVEVVPPAEEPVPVQADERQLVRA
jgi:hypothetical protein